MHPDDRKQSTGHDDTASIATEEHEDDEGGEADASDIWLWDRSTGVRAQTSHGGVLTESRTTSQATT
jgi:hypothetical protein